MKAKFIFLSVLMVSGFLNPTIYSLNLPSYEEDERGRDVFPSTWQVNDKKLFVFNPNMAAWAAYDEDGDRVMTGGASGGKHYCEDIDSSCRTPTGLFTVVRKGDGNCVSSKFPLAQDGGDPGGAPMPYCMFFYRGFAIHGSNHVPTFNASHGCIRVFPDAAEWLSENFIDIGTKVLILPYR